jgi:curved DNA-binding protein CbpA
VSPSSSFETVQKAFIKLALEHHPDTTDRDDKKSSEHFIRIRTAFERIRDLQEPSSDDKDHTILAWTEEDFLQWFYEQTGQRLTSEQRRELVQLYRTQIPGGRYDGPAWELARRLVAEQDAFLRHQQGGATTTTSYKNTKTAPKNDSNILRRKRPGR